MKTPQLQLIKKLEDVICTYDYSCQECLEEVETVCGWYDLNDTEKEVVLSYFMTEYSEEKWISKMIEEVFTYVEYNPENGDI